MDFDDNKKITFKGLDYSEWNNNYQQWYYEYVKPKYWPTQIQKHMELYMKRNNLKDKDFDDDDRMERYASKQRKKTQKE
jgi:hypothetical protein